MVRENCAFLMVLQSRPQNRSSRDSGGQKKKASCQTSALSASTTTSSSSSLGGGQDGRPPRPNSSLGFEHTASSLQRSLSPCLTHGKKTN